jgi:antitoxin ParD1/3/4
MTKVQVSLPEPLKQFIDRLVAEGTFKDSSDYLRTLIDRDRQAREKTRIEALLIEGLDSGPSSPMTPDDWEEIEREGRRIAAGRKARKAR